MQLDAIRGRSRPARAALVGLVLAAFVFRPAAARAEITYTDGSFGVSIRLPDATAVSRIKNPAGPTGTEIAQFTLPEGNVVGRIVVSDLPEDLTFDKAVADVRAQLAGDTSVPPEKVSVEKTQVQGRVKNAALLRAWDAAHTLLNGVLLVQGPSDQMLIVYVATSNLPEEAAARKFRQVVSGFTVLLSVEDEKRLQAAKVRGLETLMSLVAPAPTAADLWDKRYFLVGADKEPYGYIVVTESLEQRNKHPGLALQMERWAFWPRGGGAEYESQKAFASWDLHEDEWSSRMETVVEAQGQPVRMITGSHSVLRIGNSLMINTVDPKDNGKPAQRVIPYPFSVMPQAWRWLVPRLLQRQLAAGATAPASRAAASSPAGAGQWIALPTYSPVRRGMETQMFSRATHGQVRQVLQREGLYGTTENWQFDLAGDLRQISSVDMRLTPCSEADARRLFAARIDQWKAKVQAATGK